MSEPVDVAEDWAQEAQRATKHARAWAQEAQRCLAEADRLNRDTRNVVRLAMIVVALFVAFDVVSAAFVYWGAP